METMVYRSHNQTLNPKALKPKPRSHNQDPKEPQAPPGAAAKGWKIRDHSRQRPGKGFQQKVGIRRVSLNVYADETLYDGGSQN